jgi:hypothetical protein
VSRDVAAIMGDKHTYLEYVPYDLGDERQRPQPPSQAADNYGLGKFETRGDNIGYLQITALRRWTGAPARQRPASWRKRPTAPP